ncbi:MAG: S8 family serine peptidase [Pacificimonas sp.]
MSVKKIQMTMSALALTVAAGTATTAMATDDARLLTPSYGDIKPFYGDIDPFYGDIDPFYGDIKPFYGDINPFYGDIQPFYGDINPFYGDIQPFWGDIEPLYGDIVPFYGDIAPFWEKTGTHWRQTQKHFKKNPLKAAKRVKNMISKGRKMFKPAFQAQGRKFNLEMTALLAKHGFDLDDPTTFEGASKTRQEAFMMDFYDTLMSASGRDQVDHWMVTAKWTPSITQAQGSGADSIIGFLDGSMADDPNVSMNLGYAGGYDALVDGHGGSVASLVVAKHDGRGVMGIAPNASIVAYNPFDETGTASYADVKKGIKALTRQGASVVNLSLGESGFAMSRKWNSVFRSLGNVKSHDILGTTVFVKAAGNDGKKQQQHVNWNHGSEAALLVVGSVGPDAKISKFSNRPGNACFKINKTCHDGNRLMDRFIVAPGEMILMSDGAGGTVRRSGTSFAAPLVSGAITLLHDRWQWLADHPHETVDIILRSATDLGKKGTDKVYGRGLLNVEASQSPLDFGALKVLQKKGKSDELEFKTLDKARIDKTLPVWTAGAAYISAFEHIGDTYRDFLIPLDESLFGKKKETKNGGFEFIQAYLGDDFDDWWDDDSDFTDVRTLSFAAGGVQIEAKGTSMTRFARTDSTAVPHQEFAVGFGTTTISAGHGLGVMALTQQDGFGSTRDFEEGRSGVNPVLGLASGGPFIGALHELDPFIALSAGLTSVDFVHADARGIEAGERETYRGLADYEATGVNFGVHLSPSDAVRVDLSYSRLDEANAVLGVQSLDQDHFAGGSATDAVTIGTEIALPGEFQLTGSATMSRTSMTGDSATLRVAPGGLTGTAFAATVAKTGVVGKRDIMRLTLSQPMHIEGGSLSLAQGEVIDRATGEIGLRDQRVSIAGSARPLSAELRYVTPVLGGGSLGLYGRADRNLDGEAGRDGLTIGGRIAVDF